MHTKMIHFRQSIPSQSHIMSARQPINCQPRSSSAVKVVPLETAVESANHLPSDSSEMEEDLPETAGLLSQADPQVATNRSMTERNRRNILRLAKTTANLSTRMKAQERRGIKG